MILNNTLIIYEDRFIIDIIILKFIILNYFFFYWSNILREINKKSVIWRQKSSLKF